jgi:hypothetical protein
VAYRAEAPDLSDEEVAALEAAWDAAPAANYNPYHGAGGRFASAGGAPASIELTGAHRRKLTDAEKRELNALDEERKALRKVVKSGAATQEHHDRFAETERRKRELRTVAESRLSGGLSGTEKKLLDDRARKGLEEAVGRSRIAEKGGKASEALVKLTQRKIDRLEASGQHGSAEHVRLTEKLKAIADTKARKAEPEKQTAKAGVDKPKADAVREHADKQSARRAELMARIEAHTDAPPTMDGISALNRLVAEGFGHGLKPGRMVEHVVKYLDKHGKDSGLVLVHGMSSAAQMHHVDVDGLKFHYELDAVSKMAVAETLVSVARDRLPHALYSAQSDVYHTSQRNKDDPMWARVYNDPDFKSAATGGNGTVCVYNGHGMSVDILAHEAGHNLATREWGSVNPDPTSDYGKAQAHGKPVSSYGANSSAEDFAEAVRMRVFAPRTLQADHPAKFRAVDALFKKYERQGVQKVTGGAAQPEP